MSTVPDIKPGAVFETPFPFIGSTVFLFDPHGAIPRRTWKPGVDYKLHGPDGATADAFCHGWGHRIIEVVSLHKPGKYPERVFFVRRWRGPDGHVFGKTALRITTKATLQRWLRMGHPYTPDGEDIELVAAPPVETAA